MRKENRAICITVDGPRGPRHEVKQGVVYLAQLTGAKIVLVRAFMARRIVFGSWDRFQLPLPFSKVKVVYSSPYSLEWDDTNNGDRAALAREAQKLKVLLTSMDNLGQDTFKE